MWALYVELTYDKILTFITKGMCNIPGALNNFTRVFILVLIYNVKLSNKNRIAKSFTIVSMIYYDWNIITVISLINPYKNDVTLITT